MTFYQLLYVGEEYNNRRGLRLPILLGRFHLGLIFSGPSSGGRRYPDKYTFRSVIIIATMLITKCASSGIANRTRVDEENNISAITPPPHPPPAKSPSNLDCDQQDFPLDHLILSQMKEKPREFQRHHEHDLDSDNLHGRKTLAYFLKGLILPMFMSLTLSFGFVIWKNRMKRERMRVIQHALEEARIQQHHYSPNSSMLSPYALHLPGGLVSDALLSVLDARMHNDGTGFSLERDDYVGEGGETARHKPYLHDNPPDYASVVDPPTYAEATGALLQNNCDKLEVQDNHVPIQIQIDDNRDLEAACASEESMDSSSSERFNKGSPGDHSDCDDTEATLLMSSCENG